MRLSLVLCVVVWVSLLPRAFSQQWEIGGAAGYGYPKDRPVSSGSLAGRTGFQHGFAVSVLGGNDMYEHLGGEVRYTYRKSDLKVSSGSASARFRGDSHAVHYDLLFGLRPRESRLRPFFAIGGGIKVYRGTDTESSRQTLSNLAVLSHTQEFKPMVSVGAGIRQRLGRFAALRVDFRDYLTPFPKQVIAPGPGARIGGWVHDFVGLIGVSTIF